MQAAVDALNATQPSYATIKKFALLDHEWSQETGELTPTLKVKRAVVAQRYKTVLDGLYGERMSCNGFAQQSRTPEAAHGRRGNPRSLSRLQRRPAGLVEVEEGIASGTEVSCDDDEVALVVVNGILRDQLGPRGSTC